MIEKQPDIQSKHIHAASVEISVERKRHISTKKSARKLGEKIDPDKLHKYVEKHPNAYQHEIAAAFGVRLYVIQNALQHLKITRKKTTVYKEAKESFRQRFLKILKPFSSESLVYVDECGIDHSLYREFAYSPRGQILLAYARAGGLLRWNTAGQPTVFYLKSGLKLSA